MKNKIKKYVLYLSVLLKSRSWLMVILLLSLILRFVFITLFFHWDEGDVMDSNRYQRVALNINHGRGFTEWVLPTALAPPFYPFFMAGIMKLFGTSQLPVKLIQILLSMLTCACVYWIGKIVFSRKTGLVAALGMAINPEIIVMAGTLYTETLYLFISCLVFITLSYAIRNPNLKKYWIMAGILMGMSILTRHVLILFPIFILAFVWIFPSLNRLRRPLMIFSLSCYLVLVPWTVRNYVVFDQIVPVASGIGGGLWHGSNRSFDGRYQYELSQKGLAKETAGLERPVDQDRTLIRESLHSIGEAPLQFLVSVLKRYIRFFIQVYEDVPQGQKRQMNPIIFVVLMISYYPVLLSCIFGVVIYRKQWRTLFPYYLVMVYSGVACAMTVVTPRYRIPLYPFMILFASAMAIFLLQKQYKHDLEAKNTVLHRKDVS
ncbi:glycosyltransferase family 39 protein [bacterium]|nr:glycosyltransferase family 39 protein [bacterium]